ncbi:hypothetical protein MNBD_PLANCTO02-2806 [hydrothermal vent metagenome]|uniref:Uncharacterized protein n=1 Tax=hydrothermal vent metagenome TaxID=652676 RepID=A0A3B1DFB8_9ZZZZ
MSRIRRDDTVGFESDSFLDIIANIVGILIILIVLAGVRVSQAPVIMNQEQEAETTLPKDSLQIIQLPTELPTNPQPQSIARSEELLSKENMIKQKLASLKKQQQTEKNQLQNIASQQQVSQNKLALLSQQLLQKKKESEGKIQTLNEYHSLLKREKMELAEVQAAWNEASQQQANVKQIKHKLTPIGRVVKESEIHFHLKKNRIAHVPIKKLIERVRPQIKRQQQWLTKYNRHQGEVGPVEGFTMKYVIERQRLSVIEELRSGRGMMHIAVTGWKIIPEKKLEAESAEQALQSGSNFLSVLQQSPLDATLTMWVYPDSFELYRKLQEFAQREGYRLAARPLPEGVNIAGSPNGSRSVGQ